MKRAYYVLLAVLMTAAATVPAMAQNSRTGVSIEIRDGKVYINGEEAEGDEDGKFVIKQDDGNDITIMVDEGTGAFWFSDDDGTHLRSRAWTSGDGGFRFKSGDGDALYEGLLSGRGKLFLPGANFQFRDGAVLDLHDRLNSEMSMSMELLDGAMARGQLFEHWADSRGSEMRDLEQDIRDLAFRIQRADEDDRTELETELDQLLFQAFDQKLDGERQRIADMQTRLEEAQNRIDERGSSRADIISRRRAQLLGERDKLDW